MIPHIVFSDAPGYFPDVHRWGTLGATPPGCAAAGSASRRCTPSPCGASWTRPARRRTGAGRGRRLPARTFDGWLGWHRWLPPPGTRRGGTAGDPPRLGVRDGQLAAVRRPVLESPARRAGPVRAHRPPGRGPSQRPSDEEYSRYLWLVQQMAEVGFDDDRGAGGGRLPGADVFMSGVMAAACEVLAELADEFGRRDEAAELRELAVRFRDGVAVHRRPETRTWRDQDVLTGEWVATEPSPASRRCCAARTGRGRQREIFVASGGWPTPPCASRSPRPPRPRPTPSGRARTGGGRCGRS